MKPFCRVLAASPDASSARHRAFTLIEMLIVIAIIVLLAAILFPVFGRVRENAKRAACASNLKQLSLGMIQYAQDYDEQLPPDRPNPGMYFRLSDGAPISSCLATAITCVRWNWADLIYPYVKNAQVYNDPVNANQYFNGCTFPSDGSNCSLLINRPYSYIYQGPLQLCINPAIATGNSHTPNARDGISYGYMYPQPAGNPELGMPIASFAFPSEKGLLAESLAYAVIDPSYMITRHFDGVNVAFIDGHVKWVKWSKIESEASATLSDDGKHFWFVNGVDS